MVSLHESNRKAENTLKKSYSLKISAQVKKQIHSEDFTRTRGLPFHDLIFFLLNMNNSSYQDELDRYFQTVHHKEFPERVVYKSNLSKARAKLKADAFVC